MIKKIGFANIWIIILVLISCNKAMPAGFWANYKKDFLVENVSDQGPNGGHRALHWKSVNSFTFNSIQIIQYARKEGWTFIDSLEFSQTQTEKWTCFQKPVFPLTETGFSDTTTDNSVSQFFPRWFRGEIKVYKFKTGWTTVEPGTDRSIEENGFVLINKSADEMAVYHLWGD